MKNNYGKCRIVLLIDIVDRLAVKAYAIINTFVEDLWIAYNIFERGIQKFELEARF